MRPAQAAVALGTVMALFAGEDSEDRAIDGILGGNVLRAVVETSGR